MRYIADSNGYLKEVSFGSVIVCNSQTCVEYTGSVPSGYGSLEEWHAAEYKTLGKWKIVNGQLTYDSSVILPADDVMIFDSVITNALTTKGEVEIYGSTPHLDFHFGNSNSDYTTRIIEQASGELNIAASNGVLANGKNINVDTSAVSLSVVSSRLTGLSYTAKYSELLGVVFVRIYGTVNATMNVGYDYNILNISAKKPNANAALAVKCGKSCNAVATSGGVISLRPLESGINGYDIYITGFWLV